VDIAVLDARLIRALLGEHALVIEAGEADATAVNLPVRGPVCHRVIIFGGVGAVKANGVLRGGLQLAAAVEQHQRVQTNGIGAVIKIENVGNAFLAQQTFDKCKVAFTILLAVTARWIALGQLALMSKTLREYGVVGDMFIEDQADDIDDGLVLKHAAVAAQFQHRQGRFDDQAITCETTLGAELFGAGDQSGEDAFTAIVEFDGDIDALTDQRL